MNKKYTLDIPEIFKDFYTTDQNSNFSINPKYDEQMENIVALILASKKFKYNAIDKIFRIIIHYVNIFLIKWWKKYRKIDFNIPKNKEKLKKSIKKLNYTPFQKESLLVKFKLLHTISELLEVYEILDKNKQIPPILFNRFNQVAEQNLLEEFSDSYISILLTAKRCGINLNKIHQYLEIKYTQRNN